MPDLKTLQDLKARVDAATGWDSNIDKDILRMLGFTWRGMNYWHSDNKTMFKGSADFTTSIDAAVSLTERVFPTHDLVMRQNPVGDSAFLEVSKMPGWNLSVAEEARTLPLAILSATLAALIAKEQE